MVVSILCALAGDPPAGPMARKQLSGPRPVVAYAGGEVVVEVHLVDAGVLRRGVALQAPETASEREWLGEPS